jgi:hypothetical protein
MAGQKWERLGKTGRKMMGVGIREDEYTILGGIMDVIKVTRLKKRQQTGTRDDLSNMQYKKINLHTYPSPNQAENSG